MSTTFGEYELLRKLASGGMGEVFLARSRKSGRRVALKMMHPHLAERDDLGALFLSEARVAARLNHPNVIAIHELGEVDGRWFLAMEFVDGASLWALTQKEALPLDLACQVAVGVARGLQCLHRATDAQGRLLGALHRDVSPSNVMVGRSGEVKLIDFGVAQVRNRVEHSGSIKGRAGYISPEAVQGLPLDHRADQFCLGIVLWELLTGKELFARESMIESLQLALQCEVPAPQVDGGLSAAVMKALSREPAERFVDCATFAAALEPWAGGDLGAFVSRLVPAEPEPLLRALAPASKPREVVSLSAHEVSALAQLERLGGEFTLEQAEAQLDLTGFPGAPSPLDVVQALREGGWLTLHDRDGQLTFSVQRGP